MILVTGGTGLLGSHLLLELVREHKEVIATKRQGSNLDEVRRVFGYYSSEADALFKLIEWVDVDILNYGAVLEAMDGIDEVYHCAAMVYFERRLRKKMIRNNVDGTANIVNACVEKGVQKLLHVSSSSAIGKAQPGSKADETMIFAQSKSNTGYSISKFKSEMEVWRGMEDGLNAVIVNPTIILGPGYWNQGSSALFSRTKKGMKFYTSGETGFVGVQDVVSAMIRLMDSDLEGERFIINSENLSYRAVTTMIARAFDKSAPGIAVQPAILMILSRMDWFLGIFTGKRQITSEQARSAFNVNHYSNEKIKKAIGMAFIPIKEVVDSVVKVYDGK